MKIKNVKHLPSSQEGEWFSAGYNLLYHLMRDSAIGRCRILSPVSRRVALYLDNHFDKPGGMVSGG